MQFQLATVFFFVSYMTVLVTTFPIPAPAPSSARGLVLARLPESSDSTLAATDVEARALKFIGDSPLAPLDAEAREILEPTSGASPPLDVEYGTPESESSDQITAVEAPQAQERGCGRWACL